MLFLFKSDNSADLLWNVEGAHGTLHIPDVRKFVNHLEIARACYDMRQELDRKRENEQFCDHEYDSYCGECGLASREPSPEEEEAWRKYEHLK